MSISPVGHKAVGGSLGIEVGLVIVNILIASDIVETNQKKATSEALGTARNRSRTCYTESVLIGSDLVETNQKKMTRPGGWSMAKDATLGGRGNWSSVGKPSNPLARYPTVQ
jgi:hypothetical protein